jgi:hypothetical protein
MIGMNGAESSPELKSSLVPDASTTPPSPPPQVAVEGHWGAPDNLPIVLSNQLAVQGFQDTIVLTFGYLAPPLVPGPGEERGPGPVVVEIQPLARFVVPLGALIEMAGSLQVLVAQIQAQAAAGAGSEGAPE